MAMHTGDRHDYIGVIVEFRDQKVEVPMFDHLNKIIQEFPKLINGLAASPAAGHLFQVRYKTKAKYLSEEQAVAFHHMVIQLLFLITRARSDFGVTVTFLTSRVKQQDEDDWGKLKRVLKYLYGTRLLKLILEVNSLDITKWFVDASHNVH